MSVKSLQGRRTTYATRIKLMKLKAAEVGLTRERREGRTWKVWSQNHRKSLCLFINHVFLYCTTVTLLLSEQNDEDDDEPSKFGGEKLEASAVLEFEYRSTTAELV